MSTKRFGKKAGMLCVFLALVLAQITVMRAKPLDAGIEDAVRLDRDGKTEQALEEYRRYLSAHPEDSDVALRLLGLLFREKRYEELIETNAQLDASIANRKEVLGLVGRAYLNLERKEEAFNTFLSIVSLEGGTMNSYRYAGNTLLSLGYVDEAKEIFRRGRVKWGERSFARELYHCYMRIKDQRNAFTELLNLYLDEGVSKEWVKRELTTLIGKDKSLLLDLDEIARGEPEYAALAGELLLEHGEIERAKQFLLQILDARSLLAFASLCMEKEYLTEAEEALLRVLDGTGGHFEAQARIMLASAYRKAGKTEEAIAQLDVVVGEGGAWQDSALVSKAEMLISDKGMYEEGAAILEELLGRNETLLQKDWFLAMIFEAYLRRGDLESAERVVALPLTPFSFFCRGEVLFLTGAYAESQKAFKSAVARALDRDFANDALERIMLMEVLKSKPALLSLVKDIEEANSRGQYEGAIELINRGFNDFIEKEERAILLYCKARTYTNQDRMNDAISSYVNIPDECPTSPFAPKALFHAAMLYRNEIEDHAMAEETLRRIIFDYPESVEAELARRELQVL
jgi:tetratricopeptide (TPR) repeat protein